MKSSRSSKIIANVVLMFSSLCCILPFVLLISSSFSSEKSTLLYGYSFWPKQFSMNAYSYLLSNGGYIAHAYGITFFITIVGTAVSLIMTTMLAYPLSRRDFPFRNKMAFLFSLPCFLMAGLCRLIFCITMFSI